MLLALICVVLVAEPDAVGLGTGQRSGRLLDRKTDAPVVHVDPDLTRKKRLRLIDDELAALERVPTAGQVYLDTMEKILPYWAISTAPLVAIGVVLRPVGYDSVNDNSLLARSIFVSLVIVGVTTAIAFTLGLMRLIEHWANEAEAAPKRALKAQALLEERARLEKSPAQ